MISDAQPIITARFGYDDSHTLERFLATGPADPHSGQGLVTLERHDPGVSPDDDPLVGFDPVDEVARHARREVRSPDHDGDRAPGIGDIRSSQPAGLRNRDAWVMLSAITAAKTVSLQTASTKAGTPANILK